MSFWNNPQNNSIKGLLLVIALGAVGAFAYYEKNNGGDTGRVVNNSVTTPAPAFEKCVFTKASNDNSAGGCSLSGTTNATGHACSSLGDLNDKGECCYQGSTPCITPSKVTGTGGGTTGHSAPTNTVQ